VPGSGIVRVILPVKNPSDWTLTIKRQHQVNKQRAGELDHRELNCLLAISQELIVNYTTNQQTLLLDDLFPFTTFSGLRTFDSANTTNASQDHVGFGCIPFRSPAQI